MSDIDLKDVKTNGHIAYGLYASAIIVGITIFAGIIFLYIKKDDFAGDLAQSHWTWLVRTFWISFIGGLISLPLMLVVIGAFTLLAISIWFIYRVIKGWIYWNDGREFKNPEAFF